MGRKYTRDQLMQIGQKLYDDGDVEGANYAARKVEEYDAETATQGNSLEKLHYATNKGLADTGRTIQDGFRRVVNFVDNSNPFISDEQKAGNDTYRDDALGRLEQRQAVADREYAPFSEANPKTAFAGELIGESIALAPVGLAGRGIALANTGRKALTANAAFGVGAAEGLATGVIGTRGGIEERLTGGLIEAAAGGVLEAGMSGVAAARRLNKYSGEAADTQMVRDEASRQAKIEEERAVGGYTMDTADVEGDQVSLNVRDTARNNGEQGVLDFESTQEADIQARAEQHAYDTGGSHLTPNEQGVELQRILTEARDGDLKKVDDAYDAWRGSHGSEVQVDTTRFFTKINEVTEGLSDKQAQFSSVLSGIFERRGIKQGKPMSVDDVENVIMDINDHWDKNTPAANMAGREYKAMLDEYVVESFGDISNLPANSPVRLGKEARIQAKAMHDQWNTGDLFDEISDTVRQGNGKVNTLRALDGITRMKKKGNFTDLRKLKLFLQGDSSGEAGTKLWKDMQASELFDALEAAQPRVKPNAKGQGSQELVNHGRYNSRFNKLDVEAQDILFGKKEADKYRAAIESWSKRGRTNATRGDPSAKGSARQRALSQGVLRAAAQGGLGGNVLIALAPLNTALNEMSAKGIAKGALAQQGGSLSKLGKKFTRREYMAAFEKAYSPEVLQRHKTVINDIISSLMTGGANAAMRPDDRSFEQEEQTMDGTPPKQ